MADESTALARLMATQAISERIYQYSRAVDRLDAAMLADVYWPDGTDDHGIFCGSASDYVTWVMSYVGAWISTHHDNGNIMVDLDGDTAWVESHWTGWYRLPHELGYTDLISCGRYLDRFECRSGIWRIAHRSCVSDWNQSTVVEGAPRPQHRLSGRRGPGDLVYRLRALDNGASGS
jgi:hypothetical protein